MRHRKTDRKSRPLELPGGNEDNTLFIEVTTSGERFTDDPTPSRTPVALSLWEPSPQERAAIAAGYNLELAVVGAAHPPVSLTVTDEQPSGYTTTLIPGGTQGTSVCLEVNDVTGADLLAAVDEYSGEILEAEARATKADLTALDSAGDLARLEALDVYELTDEQRARLRELRLERATLVTCLQALAARIERLTDLRSTLAGGLEAAIRASVQAQGNPPDGHAQA